MKPLHVASVAHHPLSIASHSLDLFASGKVMAKYRLTPAPSVIPFRFRLYRFITEFAGSFLTPAICPLDVALDIVRTVNFPGFRHCLRRHTACRQQYPLAPFVFALSPFSSPSPVEYLCHNTSSLHIKCPHLTSLRARQLRPVFPFLLLCAFSLAHH